MIDLDELERLHGATTKGPWAYVHLPLEKFNEHYLEADHQCIAEFRQEIDVTFIAAAHAAIPGLITEVRRLREVILDMKIEQGENLAEMATQDEKIEKLERVAKAAEALADSLDMANSAEEVDLRDALADWRG